MNRERRHELKVLVADSSPHMLEILRSLLRRTGIQCVHEACDSRGAVKALSANKFDLLVISEQLPPLDSITLVHQARMNPSCANRHIPVIMISSRTERSFVERARDAGITDFVCKPLSAKVLNERITMALEAPRPFVDDQTYAGPDRRHRPSGSHHGPDRRGRRARDKSVDERSA
jgi:two-component system, chemotaxis family, chemotaxis protein CheY